MFRRYGRRAFNAATQHRARILPKATDTTLVLAILAALYFNSDAPRKMIEQREGKKPIFIPISFARETADSGKNWDRDDPDYQALVEVMNDRNKQAAIRNAAVEYVKGLQRSLPKENAYRDADCVAFWLFLKYPNGPPPRYERYGIEISASGTRITTREVNYVSVHRARILMNPMSFLGCINRAWTLTRTNRAEDRNAALEAQKNDDISGWVGVRLLPEPFGYQFGYNLLRELKKTWKPPQHIARGHLKVEGFIELIGNGRACVMDVDLTVNARNLNDIYWRKAQVRHGWGYRMGPPDDPRYVKRYQKLGEVKRQAVADYQRREMEKQKMHKERLERENRAREDERRAWEEQKRSGETKKEADTAVAVISRALEKKESSTESTSVPIPSPPPTPPTNSGKTATSPPPPPPPPSATVSDSSERSVATTTSPAQQDVGKDQQTQTLTTSTAEAIAGKKEGSERKVEEKGGEEKGK